MIQYTSDLSASFFTKLWAMCGRLKCAPLDLLGCWFNESTVRSTARNAAGNASGIFQVMPAIAAGLGWDPKDTDLTRYRLLDAEAQLEWAEKYYAPHAGKLVDATACYLANFLPALLAHAADPAYVLASHDLRSVVYWANRGFDRDNKGAIVVGDLTAAIQRACAGSRWGEIVARTNAAAPEPTEAEDVTELAALASEPPDLDDAG
jgi:hypothetical protein